MAINIKKNETVHLSDSQNLHKILVGLGWDVNASEGEDFDLDASAFLLNSKGKVRGDHDVVFYGNLNHISGSVKHHGDNLTGEGASEDDEQIEIDLDSVPSEIVAIAVTVTIYDYDIRRQNFGQVSNAFLRIVDMTTDKTLVRYDLTEDYSTQTAIIAGEIRRDAQGWSFTSLGKGYTNGMPGICTIFGVDVES